jgi:hypothetical protein
METDADRLSSSLRWQTHRLFFQKITRDPSEKRIKRTPDMSIMLRRKAAFLPQ